MNARARRRHGALGGTVAVLPSTAGGPTSRQIARQLLATHVKQAEIGKRPLFRLTGWSDSSDNHMDETGTRQAVIPLRARVPDGIADIRAVWPIDGAARMATVYRTNLNGDGSMKRSLTVLSLFSLFAVACSQSPTGPSRTISPGARSADQQCSSTGSTTNNSNNPPTTANSCNNNNNNGSNTNNSNNPPTTANNG